MKLKIPFLVGLLTIVCLAQGRYYNKQYGFSMVPPPGWAAASELTDGDMAGWVSTDEMAEITVCAVDIGEGKFEEFEAALAADLEADGNKVLERRSMKLGGRSASRLLVTVQAEGIEMTTVNTAVHAPPQVFLVVGVCPSDLYSKFAKELGAAGDSFLVEEGP